MWRHVPPALDGGPASPTEPLPATAVPDLIGLASTEARRVARMAGLSVEVLERATDAGPWGQVLQQDPPAGAPAPTAGAVTLVVGSRPHVTVPDVRGRSEDEGLAMLRDAGLGETRRAARRSEKVPEGCIVRTRPRAGAKVAAGSRVAYVVASGPRDPGRGRRPGKEHARASRRPDGSFSLWPLETREHRSHP